MEALQDLCDKLCDLAKEKELLERALQNQQCGEGEGEAGTTEESKESKNLRRVMRATTKEIQLLKKSVPEELPDDGEFQYFLSVAELKKNISELKSLKNLSEKNLAYLQDQVQMRSNLLEESQKMRKEYDNLSAVEEDTALATDQGTIDAECRSLNEKIRSTKLVYRDFKRFLAQYLPKFAPEDETNPNDDCLLARLLQSLWDAFFQAKDPEEAYVKLSELDHAVKPGDLVFLIRNGIVESHPKEKDKIRLEDFTK